MEKIKYLFKRILKLDRSEEIRLFKYDKNSKGRFKKD